jgi:putative endonuclease
MNRQKGIKAEQEAVLFLEKNGFKIIEKNYYAKKFGEIDIICIKDDIYHFIEVKSGNTFEPIFNVTNSKLRKIKNSINFYLKTKKLDVPYCIDAIIIKNNHIDFIENITI